jgi:hypothetical protein
MSSRRAEPMTARAVEPVPTDAAPHWRQYSTKKHENITPKKIEFTFECHEQEAHCVLRDWFDWLEAEVRSAGLEQLHAERHQNWKAPRCVVARHASPGKATIIILPSPPRLPGGGECLAPAAYAFHDWKLEFDHELILQRLIYDVYDEPAVFVRELIQNALDATRCQMYTDFQSQNPGIDPPERPTQFPADFRERYPVIVSLTEEEVQLSPDNPTEKRKVFTIEDRGAGMNDEIIRRYFLALVLPEQ